MNYDEAIPKLAQEICVRFSIADVSKCDRWAKKIYEDFQISQSLEDLDASDRTSEKDIMSLSKAIRQLRLAVRSLEEIGWHGGKALHASASHSHRKMARFRLGVSFLEAPIVFSEQLAATADILETAKNNIPQNALSVNSAFGEGRGFERSKTKGKMYAAKKVAETCATAFQDLSGNRPTVTTDVNYNNPRGLFYNFVREIFRLLELKASPETWARAAATKVKDQ